MGNVRVKPSKHPRATHEVVWRECGVRHRFLRNSKGAAEALAAAVRGRLKDMPPSAPALSREEVQAVLRARALGISPAEAVDSFAESAAALARAHTMADLVTRRLESLALETAHLPRETRHYAEFRRGLRQISEAMGTMSLSALSSRDAEAWIFAPGAAPLTIRKRRGLLSGLLEFGRRLKWIADNPAAAVNPPALRAMEDPCVLTPAEARDYLLACAAVAPALLPLEAVRMFAGLRRAEAERLDWREVMLEQKLIAVTAGKAKTRTRRLVEIVQALDAILRPLRRESGPLRPKNDRRLRDAAMKRCGWAGDVHGYGERSESARPWPANALRHSYVSYHLAQWNDAARTALQAGHDAAMLFCHYRALVTPEAAAEFWDIRIDSPQPLPAASAA